MHGFRIAPSYQLYVSIGQEASLARERRSSGEQVRVCRKTELAGLRTPLLDWQPGVSWNALQRIAKAWLLAFMLRKHNDR